MQLARRNLLKGGLLCSTAAVAAVAVTPASAKLVEKSQPKTEEWDVVVVGAGFAGLSAALEAHEQGARVLLIEKMGRPEVPLPIALVGLPLPRPAIRIPTKRIVRKPILKT